MGKVFSILIRPIKNYNVQERAHKLIDQSKPIAAPRHRSEKISRRDVTQVQHQKDDLLLEKLKDIYVVSSSSGKTPITNHYGKTERSRRSQIIEDPDSGFLEPIEVPEGKISMRQALQLLTQYESSSGKLSEVAQEFKLDEELTRNLLKHFATFQVHVSQGKDAKDSSVSPITFFPKQHSKKPPEIETP